MSRRRETPVPFLDGIPDNPISQPIEHEFGDVVRDCLEKLDPADMEILLLKFNELLTYREIAVHCGKESRQYGHWVVNRAKERLRALLAEEGITYE